MDGGGYWRWGLHARFVNCQDMGRLAQEQVASGAIEIIPSQHQENWNRWLGVSWHASTCSPVQTHVVHNNILSCDSVHCVLSWWVAVVLHLRVGYS